MLHAWRQRAHWHGSLAKRRPCSLHPAVCSDHGHGAPPYGAAALPGSSPQGRPHRRGGLSRGAITSSGSSAPWALFAPHAEVTKAIRKQHEQLQRGDDRADQSSSNQDGKQDKDRHRGRGRHWQPALQSISEAASQSSSSFSESATS